MKRLTLLLFLTLHASLFVLPQEEKTFFLISNSHLDTQWNWDVKTTISQYVRNTLVDNMALMDKYPAFRFNYEGNIDVTYSLPNWLTETSVSDTEMDESGLKTRTITLHADACGSQHGFYVFA